jgi:hypothetical protein
MLDADILRQRKYDAGISLARRPQSAEPDVYVTTSVSMIARKAASVMARRTIRPI